VRLSWQSAVGPLDQLIFACPARSDRGLTKRWVGTTTRQFEWRAGSDGLSNLQLYIRLKEF
jgi:hypothetical protein